MGTDLLTTFIIAGPYIRARVIRKAWGIEYIFCRLLNMCAYLDHGWYSSNSFIWRDYDDYGGWNFDFGSSNDTHHIW